MHVTFMLDEFSNVALPDDYCSLLSTMRSREISSVIIIQNLAQIKALFKDTWETIPGNCDTLVYLGGNEQSTHEYISKLLGKATIDKRSSGETRGRQGSSSRNYDVLGREIMMPDEVRKMDNKKCLLFIRGFNPVLDNKYRTFDHPMFPQSADGNGNAYVHCSTEDSEDKEPAFVFLNQKSLEYYEGLRDKGEPVYIDTIPYEDFILLGQSDMERRFMDLDEREQKEKLYMEEEPELAYADEMFEELESGEEQQPDVGTGEIVIGEERDSNREDSISYRMLHWHFTVEQKEELKRAMAVKIPKKVILSYFYPETSVAKMMEIRRRYE